MEWSRFTAYSLKLQTATWRLSIGNAIFFKTTHTKNKKTLAVFRSWTNVLKIRHQDKQTAKTARKKIFTKQISTGCRPVSDLWSEATQLNQGWSKENPWSILVKDMIPGQRPYRVKLLPIFHFTCHQCIMPYFVELRLFSFLFVASVYFLLESRGKERLHNYWPH